LIATTGTPLRPLRAALSERYAHAKLNSRRPFKTITVISEDYQRSFKTLRALPVDIFLGAPGNFYGLTEKYAKLASGGPNPFVDPTGYRAYVDKMEAAFSARLEEQRKASK
jgi:hypothetical protein